MNHTKKTGDKRLVLLEALIRYADLSGDTRPHFYKDEMLARLDVCEHVFNIMLRQLGDKCCHLVDCLGDKSRYVIDVNTCLELRERIIRENLEEKKRRKAVRTTLIAASIATLLVILVITV